MPIIEWNDSFCLGVPQFDEHHQQLVGLINKVYSDLTAAEPTEHLSEVLSELIDYTIYHFVAEESWMNENAYPGLEAHRAEHDTFSGRVVEMQKDFRAGRTTPNLEVHTFLKNWLTNHILQADAEYSRYVSAA